MATDAWLMASVLPNLLFGALYGAVANLVVPLYIEAKRHPSAAYATQFIQEVFTLLTAISISLSLVAYVATPIIVHLLAPGFSGQQYLLTVSMTRIMLPTFLFWLWAGLFSSLLQSLAIYGPPAWAPVLLNVVRITSILALKQWLGIRGVAWGFTAGVGVQILIMVGPMLRQNIHFRITWSFSHPLTRRLVKLAFPIVLTSLTSSLGIIVDRIFASSLPVGTIAALNYSYLIVQLPLGIAVTPLVVPVFTRLSQHIAHGRFADWRKTLNFGALMLGGAMAILSLLVILGRTWIIRIIYHHGAFNQHSIALTSGILPFFAIGLVSMAINQLVVKGLVSLQRTQSLALWSLVSTATNVVADILLVHPLQGRGLALGTSLAGIAYTIGVAWSLRRVVKQRQKEWWAPKALN